MQECINLDDIRLQIKEQEQRLRELEEDRKLLVYKTEQILESVKELKEEVSDFKKRPSHYWGVVITAAITAIVSYIVGGVIK